MPTALMHGQVVKLVHVMALYTDGRGEEQLGELFNLGFSERDESLYLRPIAPNGFYHCGEEVIPAHVSDFQFNFRDGRFQTGEPVKLSIHASGQTHVKRDQPRSQPVAGPLQMPPLLTMEDKHLATIQIDRFSCLRPVLRATTTAGEVVDFGFPFLDAAAGRIVLWVNAIEPKFQDTDFWIALARPGGVLHVGFAGAANDVIAEDPRGFTILTGWNPLNAGIKSEQNLLFIRCE